MDKDKELDTKTATETEFKGPDTSNHDCTAAPILDDHDYEEPIPLSSSSPIHTLRLEWKDLYDKIANGPGPGPCPTPSSPENDIDPLWALIQKFTLFLTQLKYHIKQSELTQPQSQRHIEILSIQEEIGLETLIQFLIGYVTRCLLIYPNEFANLQSDSKSKLTHSQLETFQKLTKTTSSTGNTQHSQESKFPTVLETIFDCSFEVEAFKKILVQIQPHLLLPICLQYFHNNHSYPNSSKYYKWFKSEILFNLPLLPTLKLLLHCSSSSSSDASTTKEKQSKFPYKFTSRVWLLELMEEKTGGALVQLIGLDLPGAMSLIDAARLVSTLVKISLKSSASSFTQIESKVTNYSQQIVKLLAGAGGNSFQIQLCLVAGLTLATISPRLTNQLVFAHLFGPIQDLTNQVAGRGSLDPKTLPQICHYAVQLLSCPNVVITDIQAKFSSLWNTLFGIWGSVMSWTFREVRVVDAQVESQVEQIVRSLQPVILGFIKKIPKAQLLFQLSSMILNYNEKKECLNPLFYHLVAAEEDETRAACGAELEDSSVLMIIPTPPVSLTKSQIFLNLQNYCKALMKLLEKDKETLQTLFQQLLIYESKIQLSPDEQKKINEIQSSCGVVYGEEKGTNGGSRQRSTAHLLNLNDIMVYQKFIASSLLSEYENYESILEQFVSVNENTVINPDYEILHGDVPSQDSQVPSPSPSSSLFLGLVIQKLESEYDSYCSNTNPPAAGAARTGGDSSFDFTKSIVYCLDLIGVLCSTVKDSEKSSAATNTTGANWEELHLFLPFLKKFQSATTVHELQALGIPEKCEYLATFIQTRGRGVEQKSKISESSKFKEAMFNISTSLPHMRGAGFVSLRKLVYAQDPEIPKNFDLILRLSLQELRDPDTYVYTHCINALVSLGRVYHKEFLPKFVEAYVQEEVKGSVYDGIKSEEEILTLRMKIGEILVKIMKDTPSPILEKYAVQLVNVTFTLGNESKDPLLRASAIQNLAELLCYLGRPMADFLIWVGNSTKSSILTEKEPQVLRALFALIENVLEGISKIVDPAKSTNESLGTFLRDFYRLIKQEVNNPAYFADEAIKTRLENCLKLTQSIAQGLLTSPAELRPVSLFPHLQ